MISSKEDYLFYLEADKIALLGNYMGKLARSYVKRNLIWKFQRLLRKVEYLGNCGKGPLDRICYLRARNNLDNLGVKLGFTIPPNVFGPGFSIAHRGTIVVHEDTKVGENCRIHQGVTIGSGRIEQNDSPLIGNNVFIGANTVIAGPIQIADGIAIGANSYVNKSFLEPDISIGGCPAKKISNRGSEGLWFRATEILRDREESRK